jgi:hypothetical protein
MRKQNGDRRPVAVATNKIRNPRNSSCSSSMRNSGPGYENQSLQIALSTCRLGINEPRDSSVHGRNIHVGPCGNPASGIRDRGSQCGRIRFRADFPPAPDDRLGQDLSDRRRTITLQATRTNSIDRRRAQRRWRRSEEIRLANHDHLFVAIRSRRSRWVKKPIFYE